MKQLQTKAKLPFSDQRRLYAFERTVGSAPIHRFIDRTKLFLVASYIFSVRSLHTLTLYRSKPWISLVTSAVGRSQGYTIVLAQE